MERMGSGRPTGIVIPSCMRVTCVCVYSEAGYLTLGGSEDVLCLIKYWVLRKPLCGQLLWMDRHLKSSSSWPSPSVPGNNCKGLVHSIIIMLNICLASWWCFPSLENVDDENDISVNRHHQKNQIQPFNMLDEETEVQRSELSCLGPHAEVEMTLV